MRFLIVDHDHIGFLDWLYATHPGLAERSFAEQHAARMHSLFFRADFYSTNLAALGHEALEVFANNRAMQLAWLREHGGRPRRRGTTRERLKRAIRPLSPFLARTPLRRLRAHAHRLLGWSDPEDGWVQDILAAQMRTLRPDVLLNQFLYTDPAFFAELKHHVRLLVGQHAAYLPEQADLRCYDLLLSSLPSQVEYFRSLGLRSELLPLAFEPRVLKAVADVGQQYDVSFVGSLSNLHSRRHEWLRTIAARVPVDVWAPASQESIARSFRGVTYHGPAWGADMYRVLRSSRITLNLHADAADGLANNLRLFEATGMGTLLITDQAPNLEELFLPDREVVTYGSAEECAEKIRYFLDHEQQRHAIAAAGQQRTLRDHTWAQRMARLLELLRPLL